MSEIVDVFWSFRSPYSRLVTADLLKLREDYDVDVHLRVVLPLAVRNPQALFDPGNRKPPRYIALDSVRRGEMLGRPIVFPTDPDPIVQDFRTMEVAKDQPYIYRLSKLGVEANRRGRGVELADRVAALIFGGTRGWDQGDLLKNAVADAGLDLAELGVSRRALFRTGPDRNPALADGPRRAGPLRALRPSSSAFVRLYWLG